MLPCTVTILCFLFWNQKYGTERIGRCFGPIIVVWFSTLALLGLWHIFKNPEVLQSLDPRYAIRFLMSSSGEGLKTMSSVFLVITGGEALYADIGHFGKKPIRYAWFGLVFPALALNYFGQGATC